jgi:hypothetical protein
MKHSYTTNLLKGFFMRVAFTVVFLGFTLNACQNSESRPAACPVMGKWKVMAVETKESRSLDALSREIYQQEVEKMLDSAGLVVSVDSTFLLRLGGDREQGTWKWDPKDSLLRLESQKGRKSYFKIQPHGQQSFILKKELDIRGLELTIGHLPQ